MIGYCELCNAYTDLQRHHYLFGKGIREKAEEDGLVGHICHRCHDDIHINSPAAQGLSRMIGQLKYELMKLIEGIEPNEARQMFVRRYYKNYL